MCHLNINGHNFSKDEEVCKLIRKEEIVTTYVQEGDFLTNLFYKLQCVEEHKYTSSQVRNR